jgi:hypothetical protein
VPELKVIFLQDHFLNKNYKRANIEKKFPAGPTCQCIEHDAKVTQRYVPENSHRTAEEGEQSWREETGRGAAAGGRRGTLASPSPAALAEGSGERSQGKPPPRHGAQAEPGGAR